MALLKYQKLMLENAARHEGSLDMILSIAVMHGDRDTVEHIVEHMQQHLLEDTKQLIIDSGIKESLVNGTPFR